MRLWTKIKHVILGLLLAVFVFCFNFIPVWAINIKAVAVLKPQDVRFGAMVTSPKKVLRLGIPKDAVAFKKKLQIELSQISAHAQKVKKLTKNYKLVGNVWRYTLSSPSELALQGEIWLSLTRRQADSRGYAIMFWNDTIGEWQDVSYVYNQEEQQMHFSVNASNALIAVVLPKQKEKQKTKADYFTGSASWYEATGAAMNLVPLGSRVLVENPLTGQKIKVRITSTGPFIPGRIIDLPSAKFAKLANLSQGIMTVNVYPIK
ncbi:MAG: hypothetical protein A2233_02425 [Candidatus Kerfeldbacteria bacterium RIFOXYA2_FULL_38_24]|uniref:RlpA-like protein double-psi beta-barrel domain-containing protein n=1 Tax=Candidatus Kerfeldbacteria bacterium RIFOXYB2_FULL_38_14 TaxID=1798547 RepID=A0A1G2B9E3_9BACT|nr:MAG: hypothetical protein A2233_02425 [Candidatus Kerfeldbacteria bacterium RIFOXYA2_FULL_38_24]OGY85848.1 MAG: hypothetical protein A2319_05845 [Candidatus Kerfeldbacteria bacterium RIFOXYB2_FULL_38_14]OGY89113.1 MAG: hypothetical protein A2458_02535 [Candidatus Kerfeldbacteria bacterium RIFOXYC2_FULL_38_9]